MLVSGSIGFGEVREAVECFLEVNEGELEGVGGRGNGNWGENFGKGGGRM